MSELEEAAAAEEGAQASEFDTGPIGMPQEAAEERERKATGWLSALSSELFEPEDAAAAEEGAQDSEFDTGPIGMPKEAAEERERKATGWLSALSSELPEPEEGAQASEFDTGPMGMPQEVALDADQGARADEFDTGPVRMPEETAADRERNVTDWLTELSGEQAAKRSVQPPATPERTAADRERNVTGWLTELETGPATERAAESPVVPEETAAERARNITGWLTELETESAAELDVEAQVPEWLREPLEGPAETVRGARRPSGEAARPGEAAPESPAWIADLPPPVREAPPPEEVVQPAQEGVVSTREALERTERLRAMGPLALKEGEPVETSGPLAGLRGLISPEPLLGILPRSSYRPFPPVAEAYLVQSVLVEQALSAPTSRPVSISRSPGRRVIAGLGRWIIYAVLLVAMLAGVYLPGLREWIGPPEMPEATSFHRVIEGLPEGSQVLLVMDYDASLDGELTPQARAVIWHLFQRNSRIAVVSLTPQGTAIAQSLLQEATKGAPQGQYIHLGYLPPHPVSLQAFVSNPMGGTTLLGTGTSADQAGRGGRIERFDDLDLIVTISDAQEHVRWLIEQVGSQRAIRIVAGVSAASAPYIQPYYGSAGLNQLEGMLVGLAGAAAYEELSGATVRPNARELMGMQGAAQIVLAGIVLLGGVRSLVGRSLRSSASGAQTRRSDPEPRSDREE